MATKLKCKSLNCIQYVIQEIITLYQVKKNRHLCPTTIACVGWDSNLQQLHTEPSPNYKAKFIGPRTTSVLPFRVEYNLK